MPVTKTLSVNNNVNIILVHTCIDDSSAKDRSMNRVLVAYLLLYNGMSEDAVPIFRSGGSK